MDYRRRIGKSKISGTVKGAILAGEKILRTIFKYKYFRKNPEKFILKKLWPAMNKFILIIGTVCLLLWRVVTRMTFGVSDQVIQWVDTLTFHRFTREIFQMANGFYYDVSNNDMPTVIFLIIFWIIFLLVTVSVCVIAKREPNRRTLSLIILFSILFRFVVLPGELIHENDIYRYMWDGKASLTGVNPYKYAPADIFMYDHEYTENYYDDDREVTIRAKTFTASDKKNLESLIIIRNESPDFYKRIGHWQIPTIYPPAAQVLLTVPVAD